MFSNVWKIIVFISSFLNRRPNPKIFNLQSILILNIVLYLNYWKGMKPKIIYKDK